MVVVGLCVFGCVGGVWGVCLAWCRRFFVSWRPIRGLQRRFRGFWLPFRKPKTFKNQWKTNVFCIFLENDVFAHSSRSDPFLSSILDHFWCSCGPFGALLWLFLACFGPSEGPMVRPKTLKTHWFSMVFEGFCVFGCVDGVWGVSCVLSLIFRLMMAK